MKQRSYSAAMLLMAAALTANVSKADRRAVVLLEGSIESTADLISLPGYDQGLVTVRPCSACAARTLYFEDQPDLFVSGRRVSIAELRGALAAAGDTSVTVHYRLSNMAITRIVLVK